MTIIRTAFLAFLLALSSAADANAAKSPLDKHDRHAPVEVTSDSLEVFQKQNRAVFTGHVVAIQGNVRLKSDVMNVFYRNKGQPGEKKAVTAPMPDDSAIKKIEASGNVFLATPQETASGDIGIYEPEAHVIRLNDHVVLTRGKNVLKGDHLVYNLDTGQSQLVAGKTQKTPGGKQDRVHALFVPGGDDAAKKEKK